MARVNFYQASRRIQSDAEYLVADGSRDRTAGAGHFFGLSGECGLKYLLLLCGGLNRDPATGDLQGRRPHVDDMVGAAGLASNYATAVAGHTNGKYFASLPGLGGLASWRAEFRYYDTTHPAYPKQDEPKWRQAALEIQTALDDAIADGQPVF
jgi:hypothetical protein